MAKYRCFFFDREDNVVAFEALEGATDGHAATLCLECLKKRGFLAAELWDGRRRVSVLRRSDWVARDET